MESKICPIPFLVADRPMSLELLKYCAIDKQQGVFGLMGHANTSKRFQDLFREFEGNNIIKASDSGVFTKDGCKLGYEDLFLIYERMGVEYGIMIDFLKDKDRTIESAKKAIEIYRIGSYPFKLVGVTQGKTIEEYLECYAALKALDFKHIAIGGLLKKSANSGRYAKVKDEGFLEDVLETIRNKYKQDWLFLLGCYHPKRQALFKKFNVFGGDYKGWIFNYKTPETWIDYLNRELSTLERETVNDEKLKRLVGKRSEISQELDIKTAKQKEIEKETLDRRIVTIRKNIARDLGITYSQKLNTAEKFLNMDAQTKRTYRFQQIKAYLDKNIFSQYRDRLLVISCSQKKTAVSNPAPAMDLYDGPIFRMLRKMIREDAFPNNIHILIISTKYGLLNLYDLIEWYDEKMTKERANKLKRAITDSLNELLMPHSFTEVFANLGENYRATIGNLDSKIQIKYASGRIGEKLSQTKKWIASE